jgi:rod shape-determining protein MreD
MGHNQTAPSGRYRLTLTREPATRRHFIRPGRLSLCVLIAFLFQVSVAHRFFWGPLRFDMLYLLAAFLALEAPEEGTLWAILAIGLVRDLGSGGRPGLNPLTMLPAAVVLMLLSRRIYRDEILSDMVLVFAFVLMADGCQALGTVWLSEGGEAGVLLRYALGEAAVTAALSPFLFYLFDRVGLVEHAGGFVE